MKHIQTGRPLPWLAAAAAAGLGVIGATAPVSIAAVAPGDSFAQDQVALRQFRFGHDAVLGTSMDLVVMAAAPGQAVECERAVLAEIQRLSSILSTYDPTSEICQVKKGAAIASPELAQVLAAYEQWRQRTNGAIDVNMAQVIGLWKSAANSGKAPSYAELESAFQTPLALNVDALGKGYIIDRAVEVARRIAPAGLLNIGGDIRSWGDQTWPIGVADPGAPAENAPPIARLNLRNAAVATSGDYARYWEVNGQKMSHIIDPRTLRPVRQVTSATIMAPDCLTANAISTAGAVLGRGLIPTLARAFGAEAFLVLDAQGGAEQGGAVVRRSPTTKPAADSAWPASFQLSVEIALKGAAAPGGRSDGRFGGGRGRGGLRRPYVAVWIEDAGSRVVRTISVWGNDPRYTRDLSYWWNANFAGKIDLASVTRATRPPGKYTVAWDGKDDQGKVLPAGKYTVHLEINREHGRHVRESATVDCTDAEQSGTLKATAESDESKISFGPAATKVE